MECQVLIRHRWVVERISREEANIACHHGKGSFAEEEGWELAVICWTGAGGGLCCHWEYPERS
jgi:hypothetical protein